MDSIDSSIPWVSRTFKLFVNPTSQSLRSRRRVCILVAIIILLFTGSLIILHLSVNQFTRSDDPYSSDSSSSLVIRWSHNTSKNSYWNRKPAMPSDEEEENDRVPVELHSRPRHALPRRRPLNEDREQRLMRQQLELQEWQLRNLRQQILEDQMESVPQNLYNQRQTTPENDDSITDNNNQQQSPQFNMESTNNTIRESALSPEPFEDTLDGTSQTNYLTYLPYAGITNQFYGMIRAMELAKALDRTLIIPPITSSSHDKSKQSQPWSKYFDLEQLSNVTGVKVVEVHELRDAELTLFNQLKCHITCGFGSKRTIDFTAKSFLKQWRFNATLSALSSDEHKLDLVMKTLEPLKDNKYICISNAYKISLKDKSEWQKFGQHLHFTQELKDFVQAFLDQTLVNPTEFTINPTNENNTPLRHRYIAVHIRRGDFAKYCEGNFAGPNMARCLPSTEQIAQRVEHIQERLNPSMDLSKRLPVLIATNERDPEELKKFENLGWRYLDHDKMKTGETLGVFGPMMVDQMLMAHAEAMIGIHMSTFSRVGALRQRDWEGRRAEYM